MKAKKTYILVQLGTPLSPELPDIRSYLRDFLMDPGTISMPWLFRYLLVNAIIVPLRSRKVISRYRMIWDENGSPLQYHSENLVNKLRVRAGEQFDVELAMLYGKPGLEETLSRVMQRDPEEMILLPLFPHETPATTGVVHRRLARYLKRHPTSAPVRILPPFFDREAFIQLFASRIIHSGAADADRVIFSFHGLPLKQTGYPKDRPFASYQEACRHTAEQIAAASGIREEQVVMSYQSRFGRNWTGPQTEDLLRQFAAAKQSVLLVLPSFTADCLETSWEVGISFLEEYYAGYPEGFHWIRSLNADDDWVNVIFGWLKQ